MKKAIAMRNISQILVVSIVDLKTKETLISTQTSC